MARSLHRKNPAYDRDRTLKGALPYSVELDGHGDVAASSFYESPDERAGRDLIVCDVEQRVIRFLFSQVNSFDISVELLTCKRALMTYGYWHGGEPAGQWTEWACERNMDGEIGVWFTPEANWQGTCNLAAMLGKEFTLRFYGRVTRAKRRGKDRHPIVKFWECPVRFMPAIEVPILAPLEAAERAAAFAEAYDAAGAPQPV